MAAKTPPTIGTAGTPSADVLTVQGKAGMTPLDVNLSTALSSAVDTVALNVVPTSVIHKSKDYTTAATDAIWTPTAGKRIIVTNCRISTQAGTTAGMVTVWSSASATNDVTYTAGTDVTIARDSFVPSATSTPGSKSGPLSIPTVGVDYPIQVTLSANIACCVMLEGYEV